jgi:uncharacterized protein
LDATVTMTCQRCMQLVAIDLEDQFRLLIAADEVDPVAETGGFEPLIADPARLDVRWLAEEQTLLNVPLVAKHADDDCAIRLVRQEQDETPVGQQPFANLRNLLHKQ